MKIIIARADADRMVHQAQSLWSACQALWASVRSGDPNLSWHYQLRPLSNEVAAVSRAAGKEKNRILYIDIFIYILNNPLLMII